MPDARIRRPETGGEGPEYDDEWSEIVGNYAMILPVRLNLNEDVTISSFFQSTDVVIWSHGRALRW